MRLEPGSSRGDVGNSLIHNSELAGTEAPTQVEDDYLRPKINTWT